jgi:hypothetical protein
MMANAGTQSSLSFARHERCFLALPASAKALESLLDDLLVVAVSSVGGSLRPGEFSIQFWREAGLIHPSFVKRAVASVSADLIRKQLGRVREVDLALPLWFGL